MQDRTDYTKNPEKTNNGELISAYECDPSTVDAEFLLAKRQYAILTGREQKNDVIAYQIRQSFKPGEITPDEANRVGYELASRFLKGKHAFIVCTHTDRRHVHNHIIFNSTSLDCTRKFRDFLGSGRAVARLSDLICLEHGLSIIEKPKRFTRDHYGKWLDNKKKLSNRDTIRAAIDGILDDKPRDFADFLKQLSERGFIIKRGKHISISHVSFKKSVRLDSLGEGYTEADIRAALAGKATRKSRKTLLLIDIDAKLHEGKSGGYARWAKVHNLKQMAQTVNYLRENGLTDYADLLRRVNDASARFDELSARIKSAETRMAEIAVLRKHIINYSKTREVYVAYRKAGYSKKFLAEHEGDILLHKAAKKYFDELGLKKLPTVKSLQAEHGELLSQKKAAYADFRTVRDEKRELLIHKSNVEQILGKSSSLDEKENEQEHR